MKNELHEVKTDNVMLQRRTQVVEAQNKALQNRTQLVETDNNLGYRTELEHLKRVEVDKVDVIIFDQPTNHSRLLVCSLSCMSSMASCSNK